MVFGRICRIFSTGIMSLAVGGGALNAQTAATQTPTFEVASIRLNTNPNPAWNMSFTPDGLHAKDVTLLWAIHEAYGISDEDGVSGGPAWLDQKRFDIEAKFDVSEYPKPTLDQRKVMLQQLLADRFKLVVHQESREIPLYALVVAKGGPKLEETKPDNLRRSPVYGAMCTYLRSRRGTLEMQGCSLGNLANGLNGIARIDVGRRVVDQTGLTGRFNMALHWAPVETVNPASPEANPSETAGPSIFTAVKEQLGLELKPTKGLVEILVVDHAEMPTEN